MRAARKALWALWRDQSGQAVVEYSMFTFFVFVGIGVGVLGFLPAALKAYEIYVHGFYLMLSLPLP
jgi:Flp pilus assembly pilin Flp